MPASLHPNDAVADLPLVTIAYLEFGYPQDDLRGHGHGHGLSLIDLSTFGSPEGQLAIRLRRNSLILPSQNQMTPITPTFHDRAHSSLFPSSS